MTTRAHRLLHAVRSRSRTPDDDGQIMILCIAYGVLALLLVTAVVSASGVHLERKRLLALADLTALAAADSLDHGSYFGPDARTDAVSLTSSGVRTAAEAHLESSTEASRFTGLTVVEATTADGRTAQVTLAAVARPTLLTWVTSPWSDGVLLRVTARARAG